ncbi:T9SS type A sorting domain-containing protein [Mucilaginibacter sp. RS28]|uniref:T9SS type A sorting domain-containing protein n=1 Tax=Mucilaginibacter straminoryzae TaxID=2932774 RepID=A0A9X2BDC0_9SPHI|nr:T9SS type A sorting domain-containing protein [Mucilaginibacter straminoryzae]MCJ8210168.1 T9SS type A sorting domain-containing protein [Mucilaginibacter straminoryzae]
MRKKFTIKFSVSALIAAIICFNTAVSAPQSRLDTTFLRLKNPKPTTKTSYLKGLHINFPSFKSIINPSSTKAGMAKPAVEDKALTNVQIYPIPVSDQINVKYTITRNSNVTIKIMDVLGNNVLTLLSQRMEPGEQKFSYNLNKQLTSGFYFVRVVVGTESIIKRISVL